MSKEWVFVGQCAINQNCPAPIAINSIEFVIATQFSRWNKTCEPGIWIYNILDNKWKHMIKYDTKQFEQLNYHNITYNENTKDVYLYGSEPPLISINLLTQKQTIYQDAFSMYGIDPEIICVNGDIHLIGGRLSYQHFVWNPFENNSKCKLIDTFKKEHSCNGLIYLKTQSKLILLGGYNSALDERLDSIFIYDINKPNLKWTESKTKLPDKMNSFSYVLTKNERYLIILFGYNGTNWKHEIYILDLLTMKFDKSKIKAPISSRLIYAGSPTAFITEESSKNGHHLLISGYIKTRNINIIIPNEIIDIISSFYSKEFIHILSRTETETTQFKISIDAILA